MYNKNDNFKYQIPNNILGQSYMVESYHWFDNPIHFPNCNRKHLFAFGIYIVIIVSFCKLEIDIGMIFSYHLIDWKFHSIDELRIILNMTVVGLHLLHLLGKH